MKGLNAFWLCIVRKFELPCSRVKLKLTDSCCLSGLIKIFYDVVIITMKWRVLGRTWLSPQVDTTMTGSRAALTYLGRVCAPCGAGAPLFPPCPFTSSSFLHFYFSLSFIGFTYFLLFSIPSLSTRIVPLRFQAGGRRRRPNLGFSLCFVV